MSSAEGGGQVQGSFGGGLGLNWPARLIGPAWGRAVGWCGVASTLLLLAGPAAMAQTDLLGLVRAAPPASWLRVNQNTFESVWTPPALRNSWALQGTETQRIIGAWSSFAWDSRRSSLVIYGGGHANYSGNDVYTFDGHTLRWSRSSLPSRVVPTPIGDGYTYGYAADGAFQAPAAAHTYDNTVYLRLADRVLTFGGAAWNTGSSYMKAGSGGGHLPTGPYLFDPARAHPDRVGGSTGSGVDPTTPGGQMWQNRDAMADEPGIRKPRNFVNGFSDVAVIDGHDVVYVAGPQFGTQMDLYRYTIHDLADPSQDTWTLMGIGWQSVDATDAAGALDSRRRWFVRTGDAFVPFLAWDLARPGIDNHDVPLVPVDLSGGAPASFSRHGLAYDSRRRHFVLWGGGGNLWRLAPQSEASSPGGTGWVLQRLPVSTGEIPAPQQTSGGVLGKWQYATELDVFIGLQDEQRGDVWVYKPQDWADPAATPNPPTPRAPRTPAPRPPRTPAPRAP